MAATAVATAATDAHAQQTPAVLSGAQEITLNVNGTDHRVRVEPQFTLLDVLRNQLNLTGCKEVEETTIAGADTIIIDGKATLAATRLAVECVGKKITTAESLAGDEVVAGFVKHDALQCGYCTPGFVMATRAFLNKNPKASLVEIQKGLGGNICRCGTYQGITQCALEIAQKGGA
jgi:xanthine dehydrogenase YagT iron-sulfur-binding subunit